MNQFNDQYITNNKNMNIYEYFNYIHDEYYSKIKDNQFIKYFLDIYAKNELIIHHDDLIKYNIFDEYNEKYILRFLIRKKLKKDRDFLFTNNEFLLTPYAFKVCLLNSNKSKKYIDHFILLEYIYLNYIQYQNNKNENKEKIVLEKQEIYVLKNDYDMDHKKIMDYIHDIYLEMRSE